MNKDLILSLVTCSIAVIIITGLLFISAFKLKEYLNKNNPTWTLECIHGKTVKKWSNGKDELIVDFWTTVPISCIKDE